MTGRLLLLLAFVALLALVMDWRPFASDPLPAPAVTHRIGYYLDDITLRDHGRDGLLRLQLQAARASEDPGTGEVALEDVAVDWQQGASGWRLTAERARAPQGGERVELEGAVRMRGAPGPGGVAELLTESLVLETQDERAHTDDEVLLSFGRHALRARGLQADLKAGRVRLESSVHGTFSR